MTSKNHGGPRKGAGRPKLAEAKRHLAVRLSPDVWRFLKEQGNTSAAVEQIVKRSTTFKTWSKTNK